MPEGIRHPIVMIGVHTKDGTVEEINKVVQKLELRAPICIDTDSSDQAGWGEFFARCRVRGMPTTVGVDEEGKIFAHGSFNSVYAEAMKRTRTR